MSSRYPTQTGTGHQVSTARAPPSFPSRPGTSILIDCRSEGSLTVDNYARRWTGKDIRSRYRLGELITINILPDDVLIEIFDFCVIEDFRLLGRQSIEGWQMLAHVCRRWRSVVFQSPRRLNLRLLCTPKTLARNSLDIWPPLPLVIRDVDDIFYGEPLRADNIIAALEHNDRVGQIELKYLSSSVLGRVTNSAAIQKSFPELTDLRLRMFVDDEPRPRLPDSFLGGTAPRLRSLSLYDVPFPGLPKLLLSTTHLVNLDLYRIPHSGYIPPEVMATTLSALTSLESLRLHFRYPRPRPALESRRLRPPPLTRSIVFSLTKIRFKGASEYLEEILARIDAPRLHEVDIVFFNQIIFDLPQLFQFVSRRPTLRTPQEGRIAFYFGQTQGETIVRLSSDYGVLSVNIPCTAPEWQLSSLEQVCTSSLPPLSTLEDLYILEKRGQLWPDDDENTLWLDLLRSFVAVKNLYLPEKFVPRIASALQELVGERTTEVLPTLENIYLEGFQTSGSLHEGIKKFVAARRLTGHTIAVSRWDRDKYWEIHHR